jgi:hypothetical protein
VSPQLNRQKMMKTQKKKKSKKKKTGAELFCSMTINCLLQPLFRRLPLNYDQSEWMGQKALRGSRDATRMA